MSVGTFKWIQQDSGVEQHNLNGLFNVHGPIYAKLEG